MDSDRPAHSQGNSSTIATVPRQSTLHPATLYVPALSNVIGAAIPVAVILFTGIGSLLLVPLAIAAVAVALLNVVRYVVFRFEVGTHEIALRDGVIEKKERKNSIRPNSKRSHRTTHRTPDLSRGGRDYRNCGIRECGRQFVSARDRRGQSPA